MSLVKTGLGAIGTFAALKSLTANTNSGSTAGGGLGRFLSEIRQHSVARTNYFDVRITVPSTLRVGPPMNLSLFAEGTTLPGLFIQTGELKRFGIGPVEKYPYSLQTNKITFNFIGDGKGEIYKFFYRWMQSIVKADIPVEISAGDSLQLQQISQNGLAPYEVEFKENYAVPIQLFVYNEQSQTILNYNLTEAFPISIPDVSLSWSNDNSLMQFAVDFEFLQSQLVNAEDKLKVNKNGIGELNTLQKLIKVGTAVQALASLRKPQGLQDALISAGSIKNVIGRF